MWWLVNFATVAHEPRFTTNNEMGCVVREPLHDLAAQLKEAAIFEGEPVLFTYLRRIIATDLPYRKG